MLTRAEGRRQRRQTEREIAADHKARAKKKIRELRESLRTAKRTYGGKIAAARSLCRGNRKRVRDRARARRRRLLEELRTTERLERQAARDRCSSGKSHARREAKDAIEKNRLVLEEEKKLQADLKRLESANRANRHAFKLKTSAAERRSESDSEVESNIDPELVPLWQRVRGKIRGSTRLSRTEAFLHYALENPDEVVLAQESGVDAEIAKLERQLNDVERFAKKKRYTPAELADVPF